MISNCAYSVQPNTCTKYTSEQSGEHHGHLADWLVTPAAQRLIRACAGTVVKRISRSVLGGSSVGADDIGQEIVILLLQDGGSAPVGEEAAGDLVKSAANRVWNSIRRELALAPVTTDLEMAAEEVVDPTAGDVDSEGEQPVQQQEIRADRLSRVKAAMATLSEPQRAAILVTYFGDGGKPVGKACQHRVRSRRAKAIGRLKRLVAV